MAAKALLAIGGAAAAFALWPRGEGKIDTAGTGHPADETGTQGEPRATNDVPATGETHSPRESATSDTTNSATEAGVPDATKDADPIAPVATRPARLTVLVSPWGQVWIDGKARGPAPLKSASLKPGRYKITAGQDSPLQTRTVLLREGERKTIRFDLAD